LDGNTKFRELLPACAAEFNQRGDEVNRNTLYKIRKQLIVQKHLKALDDWYDDL
jgi:hypothetical protein